MATTEKGGYVDAPNPAETASSIQALQQMGALVSLDRTAIKLTDTPFRAYKLNGGNPETPNDGIGNGRDKMKSISLKNSKDLTITYEDGTISKFYIGTTPPPKPVQNQWPTLASMQTAFNAGIPGNVMLNYDVALKNKSTVVINKPEEESSQNSKAMIIRNKQWGIDFSPSNNEDFKTLNWKNEKVASLNGYNIQSIDGQRLQLNGTDTMANTLNWTSNTDWGKIIFTDDGIISVCKATGVATYIPINAPASAWAAFGAMAKKPVIYLYPRVSTEITVSIELSEATMVAEYPKTNQGKWKVLASPRGGLTDLSTGKKYSYLFWEAEKVGGFQLDTNNAHCVPQGEVCEYLEKSLKTLGLNAKESNDFIVYWLPILEQNPFSLIEWKTKEYTDMAKLHISPTPDSVIRVFMVFQKSEKKVVTGNPKLQKAARKGYVAVEWGGCNMNECTSVR